MARRRSEMAAAVGIAVASMVGLASANSSGPLFGSARTGCGNGCHGTTPAPQITVEAPGAVDESRAPVAIRVSVADDLAGGGGFMIEASAGRILVEPGTGVRSSAPNEATHDGSQPLLRSWLVDWMMDGPVAGCAIDLRVAAMATNADADYTGDHWGPASAQIALVPAADGTSPVPPTFVSPAAGAVVFSGGPVPILSGVAPAPVVIGSVEFRLAATDDTGVREVRLRDTDVTGAEVELGPATLDRKTGLWVLAWTTQGITPGPHTIRAVATDCAGNASQATLDVVAF
jgi:hypothetical protein